MPESIGTFIGPYRITGLLGRGGVGSVYRAEDGQDGRLVAVKTLERPLTPFLPTLRREIAALARLEHPGIVRVLGSGARDGIPWYAMELVAGPGLLEHCRGRPLPEVLSCVRRLCGALAYLHGEGLVHRDLKPDNVLVRCGGYPVLVDFGLVISSAAEPSREALDIDVGVSGTLLYMSPEQLRGEFCDARTDLYSLGCILYELLAGRPPFPAESAAELVRSHLHEPVEPLSKVAPDLPEALDALVVRLLAKRPRDRLGHADDVAAALAPFAPQDEHQGQRPRAYLYRPEMAGRDEPLQQLEAHLEQLEAGRGGLVLVGGESGVGKSRLAMELARRAARRKVRVLGGECLPLAGSSPASGLPAPASAGPLHPLRRPLQAIADRCRGRGKAETTRLLGRRGSLLGLYEPALRGLPGQESDAGGLIDESLPAEAVRRRLYEALSDTFAALAADGPLLLLLDDLHWADDLTLGWLEHLLKTQRLGRTRLLVVATYRTEEKDRALDLLLGSAGVVSLRLDRLQEESVAQIVSDMLALPPAPLPFVRFLTRHSEGNPFFVAEYLRAAIAEGILCRDPEGRWQLEGQDEPGDRLRTHRDEPLQYEALPLPRSLRETVGRRLDAISPEAQALVCRAAVLGREPQRELLLELAKIPESQAWAPLEELRVREVLEEPAPGCLRFAHDKLREVAYERIGPLDLALLHRGAAEALEKRRSAGHPEDPAILGGHWERAGAAEPARARYLEAARQAAGRHALTDALKLYGACLRLHERPAAESLQARMELSVVILRLGRVQEAMEQLRSAVREAEESGDRLAEAQGLLQLGQFCLLSGGLDESEAHCRQAVRLAEALGDRVLESDALRTLSRACSGRGRSEEARLLCVRAVSLAREAQQPRKLASALGQMGQVLRHQGRFTEAQSSCEEALGLTDVHGWRQARAFLLCTLGSICFDRGDLEEAGRLYVQSLELARETGQPYIEQTNLKNLGDVGQAQGRIAEARGYYEQALELSRQLDFHSSHILLLNDLADLHSQEGRIAEALSLYEQAQALSWSLGRQGDQAGALIRRVRLARRSGDLATAWALLEEAKSLLGAVDVPVLEALQRCECGHLALAGGASVEAAAALGELQDLVSRMSFGPDSELGRGVARLQRAMTACGSGQPLFRGECWEDVPSGLQR